jgi:hypothetical protein
MSTKQVWSNLRFRNKMYICKEKKIPNQLLFSGNRCVILVKWCTGEEMQSQPVMLCRMV